MHLLSQDSAPLNARLVVTQVDHDSTLAEVHLTHVAVDTHDLGMNQLQAPPAIPSLRLPHAHGAWPVPHLLLVALQPPHLLLTPAESLDYILSVSLRAFGLRLRFLRLRLRLLRLRLLRLRLT